MAGTVTITEQLLNMVKKVTFDWSATSSGGLASDTTTHSYDGEVLRVVAMGSASATGYALEIQDSDGIDLLGGQGAALTSGGKDFGTSTGGSLSYPLSAVSGKLSLSISGGSTGGTASTGQIIVYVR